MMRLANGARRKMTEREGLPCFDLFMGVLLWGMRHAREPEEQHERNNVVPAFPALNHQ